MIRIDKTSSEPLYLQIRLQVIAAIASGRLQPQGTLPSVRVLARDLGINLHTVNKAYATLRDEGYLIMQGRSGARVADPASTALGAAAWTAEQRMDEDLYALALAFRARGGLEEDFIESARQQAKRAFGRMDEDGN